MNRADTSTWDVPVYPRNQTTGHYIHALLHGLFHGWFLNSLSKQSLISSTGVLPPAYAILHHAGRSPLSSASARTSERTQHIATVETGQLWQPATGSHIHRNVDVTWRRTMSEWRIRMCVVYRSYHP